MPIMSMMALAQSIDDAELVAQSLAGNREAFGGIVARYQSIVCSIAFSASGSVSQSEDVAQETFLLAWRQLTELRDPSRLRAWLCGIARNLVQHRLRSEGRGRPEPIEAAEHAAAPGPLAREALISREEETLVWRSLEQLPPRYREPLVLFYRQQGSVAHVAAALGLSEEVVRQRLSRGRRLLQAQVQARIEGVLVRSGPGEDFTLGVVAALPVASGSAASLSLGSAALKSGLAKTAGAASLSALAGPLISALPIYFSIRAGLDTLRTGRERRALLRQTFLLIAVSFAYGLGLFAMSLVLRFWDAHPTLFVSVGLGYALAFGLWLYAQVWRGTARSRRLRAEEKRRDPAAFAGGATFEYRSRARLFGIPLVHIRQAPPDVGAGPALGILAVGDRAVGVVAFGECALGVISMGAVSVGVISVGGASAGLWAMGGFALGGVTFGGASLGVLALGALSFGWHAAVGGMAAARIFALGPLALGEHADDAAAADFFARLHVGPAFAAMLALIFVVTAVPAALFARRARRISQQAPP